MNKDIFNDLSEKKILIWGLGREGTSTYNLLRKLFPNIKLYLIDQTKPNKNDFTNVKLLDYNVNEELFNDFDIVFKSPGISTKGLMIDKDKITSQTEFFLKHFSKQTIGITGTKGKSTTSSLLFHILSNANIKTVLVGNIGKPCFDYIEEIGQDTIIVYEMSSHQLEYINYSPHIGVILNIYKEHLDHYEGYEKYIEAKNNIIKFQKKDDIAIINENILSKIELGKSQVTTISDSNDKANIFINEKSIYFNGEKISISRNDTKLIGIHNWFNISVVLYICNKCFNIDLQVFKKLLGTFSSLPHRLEYIGTFNDILYYNDSISTIPESTIMALESLDNVNTVLIGGKDRNIDYDELIKYLQNSNCTNIIFMHDSGNRIYNEFINIGDNKCSKKLYLAKDFSDAIDIAKKITSKNSICLLSPASSSYGFFKDFTERGDKFKELVSQI